RALIYALEADCEETPEAVPESFELTQLVTRTVRDTLRHFEMYLDAFADGVITKSELDELLSSGDQVIQHIGHFKAIARTDYERRQRLQPSR
ncbi:MAG TPA: hypothetical protein VE732_05210, partial [Nitrososphaera sp.]|nr:hypothetical protein [Nitrososphaera sp.]